MIKIGVTSNIRKYYKNYIDFSDHYWSKAFDKKNLEIFYLPNNINLSQKLIKYIDILILSGGNDILSTEKSSKIRNKVELNLIKCCLKKKIPIIGVCRGAQLLNIYFGGKITKIKNQMNTRHNIFFKKNKIFNNTILNVNSYHNFGIKNEFLSKKLDAVAIDKEKNIEIFCCLKNKVIGTMWHPEREKNLKNLFKLIDFFKR